MILHLNGMVDGKRIDLEKETGLPPGTPVTVHVETRSREYAPKEGVLRFAGLWKNDESIARRFEQILRERETRTVRDVDFDAPS